MLTVIPALTGQVGIFGLPRVYDFVLTTKRIAGIVRTSQVGDIATGGFGGSAGIGVKRWLMSTNPPKSYIPDELEDDAARDVDSFVLSFSQIERIKVGGFGSRTLTIKAGGKAYRLGFDTGVWDWLRPPLSSLLPRAGL